MKVSGPKGMGMMVTKSLPLPEKSHFQLITRHVTGLNILAHERLAFVLFYMKNFSLFALIQLIVT
jgi:hypothetical protein